MSSFSGLSTALSSLIAQRQALDVAGQNIANANTKGYTRQRADLASVQALTAPTMFSAPQAAGNGVRAVGITRMGDVFLDARVRSETAGASFQRAQAVAFSRLESTVAEPTDVGVANGLHKFWSGWQAVANNPDDVAARKVLLGDAKALVTQISAGYTAVETQWAQSRSEAETMVAQVNTTASGVAQLNERIRSILVSGGSANELIDQRDLLVTQLSGMVGAAARVREDGTVDVMVGGNALVRGIVANEVRISEPHTMSGAVAGGTVGLSWARTGTALSLDGGALASHMTNLGPGGLLVTTAERWNDVATALRTSVNAVHTTGHNLAQPPAPTTGLDFFAAGTGPAATGLSVALTSTDQIGAADPTRGPLDGSFADRISQLATAPGGPDEAYRDLVVDLGVQTRAAMQRATVSEASRATAENLQLSNSSVDLDEEMTNMLAYQRAYEGAARVLTAIDQMLDVLINRTGVVGR